MTEGTKRRWKKRWLWVLAIMLIVYVGSYCVLSHFGAYCIGKSGKVRLSLTGSAWFDTVYWQPKFVWGQLFYTIRGKWTYHGNVLGSLYAPLLILDQKYVHETYTIEEFDKKSRSESVNGSEQLDH